MGLSQAYRDKAYGAYHKMRPFIRNTVFFIGWLLSPLTFWNDAFVNIPLSYLLANLLAKLIRADFLWLVLISYWLTNVAGLYLMYTAGQGIVKSRAGVIKEVSRLLITSIVYSLIIVAIARLGILKPF